MNNVPTAQAVLAGLALAILGILGGALIFQAIPKGNETSVAYILGAISGILTTVGVSKALHQDPSK